MPGLVWLHLKGPDRVNDIRPAWVMQLAVWLHGMWDPWQSLNVLGGAAVPSGWDVKKAGEPHQIRRGQLNKE